MAQLEMQKPCSAEKQRMLMSENDAQDKTDFKENEALSAVVSLGTSRHSLYYHAPKVEDSNPGVKFHYNPFIFR